MTATADFKFDFKPFEFEVDSNRYAGRCLCGEHVPAGAGFYWDSVYCSQPGRVRDTLSCERDAERESARQVHRLTHVPAPRELSEQEKARAAKLAAKRAAEDAAWAKQGLERCTRCGGAGGHNSWPGFTCFRCDGIGALPKEL